MASIISCRYCLLVMQKERNARQKLFLNSENSSKVCYSHDLDFLVKRSYKTSSCKSQRHSVIFYYVWFYSIEFFTSLVWRDFTWNNWCFSTQQPKYTSEQPLNHKWPNWNLIDFFFFFKLSFHSGIKPRFAVCTIVYPPPLW